MTNDDEFLHAFETHNIPKDQWRHREHLRVAYLLLTRYPFDEALDHFRAGVKAINILHGLEDTPTQGYHETMTVAWLRLVAAMIREYGKAKSSDAFCSDHPELGQKFILRLFYSRRRIMSAEAKAGFVEPDLTALP
ncbi:MAG: hypothetical protein H6810_10675 [Phycisphaeraceae bacterium]|nr:MAG: hypothetical protein H6810_10675 [Phycisphaeraceae bacterium]